MSAAPRVLILTAYYFPFQGGVETHARAIARDLRAQGASVIVVTRRRTDSGVALETIDDVPVHRVRPGGARTGPRKWLMIPFALAEILNLRNDFDVIYCPGYEGIGIAAIIGGWSARRPVVLRSGNLGVLAGWNWNAPLERAGVNPKWGIVEWLKGRVRKFYMSADAFVANCRDIENEALDAGVPRSHLHYLPNAVDIERFRPARDGEVAQIRAHVAWPSDAKICLYVGRLSDEKGVRELLAAWKLVSPPDWRLIFVGPDMTGAAVDAGPWARKFVSDNHLQATIAFHGEAADASPLYRAADLYVLPSHYEAFSNSLIEAMGSGLAVVATRVGGNLDAVVDGENGLLATAKDPADLAKQLLRAMEDGALRARLGAAARATVVASFNKDIVFRQFRELFAGFVGVRS